MAAPIILFVYNRPVHTKNTLDALANNYLAGESVLFIFSDGPKNEASAEELNKINAVRSIAAAEKRFKEVKVIESVSNKGLAGSIVSGVTKIVNEYEKIIVLEDDIITSKY